MKVYDREFDVNFKSDSSPVTKADQHAEDIILDDLKLHIPNVPVVAEEAASGGNIPDVGDRFFLVDPLDGTKEFIQKNDEFTVNIALIENGIPVFGIIYAPALSVLYVTLSSTQAIKANLGISDTFHNIESLDLQEIHAAFPDVQGLNVIMSRSHMSDETTEYLKDIQIKSTLSAGSSLKFCKLAEGVADLYPRFAPTMEWDTAAGHAILLAAGGRVETPNGQPLGYGKSDKKFLNSEFIAFGLRHNTAGEL